MPGIDPGTASAIQSGSDLLGQMFGFGSTMLINKQQRKWNEYMYGKQRADALADWMMQNEYNHPSSQMARLREAGLNPNLVYGNGADAMGGVVRSTESKSWNPEVPKFDLGRVAGSGLAAFYDTQVKQATVDNLRRQNTVLENEAMLKLAQTIGEMSRVDKTRVDTRTGEFDLAMKNTLAAYNIEARKKEVEKLGAEVGNIQAQTQLTITKNDVERIMKAPNLEKVIQEVRNLQMDEILKSDVLRNNKVMREKAIAEINEIYQKTMNLLKEGKLKDFELMLKNLRGNKADMPWYIKLIDQMMRKSVSGSSESIWDMEGNLK